MRDKNGPLQGKHSLGWRGRSPNKRKDNVDSGMENILLNEKGWDKPQAERMTNTKDTLQPKEGGGKPSMQDTRRNMGIPGNGEKPNKRGTDATTAGDISSGAQESEQALLESEKKPQEGSWDPNS